MKLNQSSPSTVAAKKSASLIPSLLVAGGCLFGGATLTAAPAEAFTLSFDSTSTSSNDPATGASATADFAFSDAGAGQVKLDLTLTNTTGTIPSFGDGATESTLVGFAFDLSNLITNINYDSLSSTFTQFFDGATLQPFGTFDVGIRSAAPGGTFGGGKPTDGLEAGESSLVSFLFNVTGGTTADSLEASFLSGFNSGDLKAATRFQQVNAGGGSDKLSYNPPTPTDVPEPASLLGLALVGGAATFLRRKSSKVS